MLWWLCITDSPSAFKVKCLSKWRAEGWGIAQEPLEREIPNAMRIFLYTRSPITHEISQQVRCHKFSLGFQNPPSPLMEERGGKTFAWNFEKLPASVSLNAAGAFGNQILKVGTLKARFSSGLPWGFHPILDVLFGICFWSMHLSAPISSMAIHVTSQWFRLNNVKAFHLLLIELSFMSSHSFSYTYGYANIIQYKSWQILTSVALISFKCAFFFFWNFRSSFKDWCTWTDRRGRHFGLQSGQEGLRGFPQYQMVQEQPESVRFLRNGQHTKAGSWFGWKVRKPISSEIH